jgi:hypothetical protein
MGGGVRMRLALTFASAGLIAAAAAVPASANAQAGAEKVIVVCTVTAQNLSKNCRFDYDIDDEIERMKAGTELGYLDNHPFPIAGVAGTDVKVLVRLNVSVSPDPLALSSPRPAGPYRWRRYR